MRRRSRRTRRVAVGAVAATAILTVVATLALLRLSPQPTTISAWPQRVVAFTAPGGSTPAGELAIAYTPGRRGFVLWGSGLPDPGPGETYELWMIAGTTPTSGGCLRSTDGRVGAVVDARLGWTDLLAVTVEPVSCPTAPTTAPVFTAPLP